MNREYCYLIRIEDPTSQAGNYAGGGSDGAAVKAGQGIQGRLTGGSVVAKSDKDAREKIQDLYSIRVTTWSIDPDGKLRVENEIVKQKIYFLDINPRGVILSPDEVS